MYIHVQGETLINIGVILTVVEAFQSYLKIKVKQLFDDIYNILLIFHVHNIYNNSN